LEVRATRLRLATAVLPAPNSLAQKLSSRLDDTRRFVQTLSWLLKVKNQPTSAWQQTRSALLLALSGHALLNCKQPTSFRLVINRKTAKPSEWGMKRT